MSSTGSPPERRVYSSKHDPICEKSKEPAPVDHHSTLAAEPRHHDEADTPSPDATKTAEAGAKRRIADLWAGEREFDGTRQQPRGAETTRDDHTLPRKHAGESDHASDTRQE